MTQNIANRKDRVAIHLFTAMGMVAVLIAGGSVVAFYVGMGSMDLAPLVFFTFYNYLMAGIAFIAFRRKKAVLRRVL